MKENYQNLCTEFYELDKPFAPTEAIVYYLRKAAEAKGKILEPMCGTGRFLIPLAERGYDVVGFDQSSHMLAVCKKKSNTEVVQASFNTFKSDVKFQLVFIPSGSFCLLVNPEEINSALKAIFESLAVNGKFIFEVETLNAVNPQQGIWQTKRIHKPDGSLLVGSFASTFDVESRIETILCRYELWQNDSVVQTEVEELRIRFYELNELDILLQKHGFRIERKLIPYTEQEADADAPIVLYECCV